MDSEFIQSEDICIIGGVAYYKLTSVLKRLHIKRFDYHDTTGEDNDFITYDGVVYISPYMVMKLTEQAEKESVENETQLLQYINPWATGN